MPPPGWIGWPDGKQFALVIQHDVDTQKGHDNCCRLMDVEERLGVCSCYNIVPERYTVSDELLKEIKKRGFGLGVHGLRHDGKLFLSYDGFRKRAAKINNYLHKWNVRGYSSPSMLSKLEWMHHLDIDYSTSTFDTDPFEPQQSPVNTIFPFIVNNTSGKKGFVELPYTLVQDFTLFVILQEKTLKYWETKLDWIATHGGMALFNTHPDYMNFGNDSRYKMEEYPVRFYTDFLRGIQETYKGRYWNARPEEVAAFFRATEEESL